MTCAQRRQRLAFADGADAAERRLEDMSGPVRIFSKREVCWNIRGLKNGQHRIVLLIDGHPVEKELVVGSGLHQSANFGRVGNFSTSSCIRVKQPFRRDEQVRSIEIEYPTRSSWTAAQVFGSITGLALLCFLESAFARVFNVSF